MTTEVHLLEVLRVEHHTDGHGPFVTRLMCNEWADGPLGELSMPTPGTDDFVGDYRTRYSAALRWTKNKEWAFAAKPETFDQWFRAEHRARLEKHGFVIRKYVVSASDAVEYGTQVAFHKSKAVAVWTKRPTEIEPQK